ncbi:MAG: sulfite exporter TauE/SafE family protein [Hyphomicrobiaceae bacterium]
MPFVLATVGSPMTILGLTLWQLAIIAGAAFCTQIVGGIAGYGTGLLLPLVLVPIIGPEAIVPVIGLSALITNPTRVLVFREHLDLPKALLISSLALPTTVIGAWGYTLLSGRGAAMVIGAALILMVPLRRFLARHHFRLRGGGIGIASIVFGFFNGGMTGSGIMLISMLMAMGLTGQQVIATDALTSTIVGLAKTGVFYAAGALPAKLCLVAVLIGVMATPGTLMARWLVRRFSARLHDTVLEGAIILGGSLLIWRAIA